MAFRGIFIPPRKPLFSGRFGHPERPFVIENSPKFKPIRLKGFPEHIQRCLLDISKDHPAALAVEHIAIRVNMDPFGP